LIEVDGAEGVDLEDGLEEADILGVEGDEG
jgi:hypothetical protein